MGSGCPYPNLLTVEGGYNQVLKEKKKKEASTHIQDSNVINNKYKYQSYIYKSRFIKIFITCNNFK
jgi:hypothetical protein